MSKPTEKSSPGVEPRVLITPPPTVMSEPIEKSSPGSEPQAGERHPTREEIELRAHDIYLERGGAHGQDVEDWLQAERELIEKYAKTGRMAKAKTA